MKDEAKSQMGDLKLIRKPSQAVIWLVVSALLALGLRTSALPQVSFLGIGIIIFPLIMLFASALGGALPALAGLGILGSVAFELFGVDGLWLLPYLGPFTLAFIICLEKEIPFFKASGILILTYVFSVLFVFLMLQHAANGDLYGAAASAALKGLEDMPFRDPFLLALWRSGFLQHGQDVSELVVKSAPGNGWVFRVEVLEQFYKQIDARIRFLLSALLPGLITSNAIGLSLLGSGLALKAAARYQTAPTLGMPPFSTWYLPRILGKRMLVLALGYLLTFLHNSPVVQLAGQLMYNVFATLYAIQGLAFVNFTLKKRGTKRSLRYLVMGLMYFLLSPAAMILGVFDQFSDPRKLRVSALS